MKNYQLDIQTKLRLTSGYNQWWSKGSDTPYVPSFMMCDGPHGLRKQSSNAEHINDSKVATCFPTACASACSWDTDLLHQLGDSIGKEALAEQVSLVLGPGVNIKRTPLCGRNFEYFSEDPYLAGRLAASFIQGVQSNGVGTSLKHFAANSQETRRMTLDTLIDERALREIYLSAFEYAVKTAEPSCLMAAYNKINGYSCTENKWLLTDVLRKEWGFKGFVVSDWGATYNIVAALKSGMDLEMPDGRGYSVAQLTQAYQNGEISEEVIDTANSRLLKFAYDAKRSIKEDYTVDYAAQHQIAVNCEAESAVLLLNDGTLPLAHSEKILLVGEMAVKMRFQGAGSSHINTASQPNLVDVLKLNNAAFEYVKGYSVEGDVRDEALEKQVYSAAAHYDTVVFCGGLTDVFESEGYDRTNLNIPNCQIAILTRLVQMGKKVVFLAFGGAPFIVPMREQLSAMLNMYLGGQGVDEAAYEMLYGVKNPCGKLSESWPLSESSMPCYNFFNKKRRSSEHRESIFVGYRYYDTFGKKVAFPFGYGLSYTQFAYTDFAVKKNNVHNYTVTVNVSNVGKMAGREIVQLYVQAPQGGFLRAKRELKGFIKTDLLLPGESQSLTFTLDKRSFAHYDVQSHDFLVAQGNYTIEIAASLGDVKHSKSVAVEGVSVADVSERFSAYFDYVAPTLDVPDDQFTALLGKPLVEDTEPRKGSFTLLNTLEDMKRSGFVRLFTKIAIKIALKGKKYDKNDPAAVMTIKGITEMPLVSASAMSGGQFSRNMCLGLVAIANGRFFKGLGLLLKKEKSTK